MIQISNKQNRSFLNRFSVLSGCCLKFFLICSALLFVKSGFAQDDIAVESIVSKNEYSPGDTAVVALSIDIPEKFHLYGNPLGPGIGKPLSVSVTGFQSVKWIEVKKTEASKYSPPVGDWVWAYENKTDFFLIGVTDPDFTGTVSGNIIFSGLICHNSCIPVNKSIPVSIDVSTNADDKEHFGSDKKLRESYRSATGSFQFEGSTKSDMALSSDEFGGLKLNNNGSDLLLTTANNTSSDSKEPYEWNYSPREKSVEFNIAIAILFGFIAGIILNFMPCVLPVLGIKIVSFSKSREGSRKETIVRSLFFAAGIISVFMIFAALASFANFSWGQQFQNPKVLIGIIVLIVIFALGTFDIFMINIPGSVAQLERKSGSGILGDFFKGMFTTVMATPCSGPLLGATLAWAVTQPPLVIFTVFTSIGAGMAFPYVLLSLSSKLSGLIPKPGGWMNDFKIFTGFILLGMAVYMMMSLPQDMVVSTVSVSVFFAFAIVAYTRYAPFGSSLKKKILSGIAALLIAGAGIYTSFAIIYKNTDVDYASEEFDSEWKDFSFEKLEQANKNAQHVIVDFTARWCMNCKINKAAVLNTKEIRDLIREKKILALKVDLTQPDPHEQAFLYHLGSRSVPFLAIFPGNDPYNPVVMRDLLNKRELARELKKL